MRIRFFLWCFDIYSILIDDLTYSGLSSSTLLHLSWIGSSTYWSGLSIYMTMLRLPLHPSIPFHLISDYLAFPFLEVLSCIPFLVSGLFITHHSYYHSHYPRSIFDLFGVWTFSWGLKLVGSTRSWTLFDFESFLYIGTFNSKWLIFISASTSNARAFSFYLGNVA